jgi:hypothetical protein
MKGLQLKKIPHSFALAHQTWKLELKFKLCAANLHNHVREDYNKLPKMLNFPLQKVWRDLDGQINWISLYAIDSAMT